MDNILNQKTRSFFDEVDLFKQTANNNVLFQEVKKISSFTNKVYYGETVRGMTHVSPLVEKKFVNQTSDDILEKYFIDAEKQEKGNSNIVTDVGIDPTKTELNGFIFHVEEFYWDSDKDGVYGSEGDTHAFNLLIFASTDGLKVRECYEITTPKDDQIILFLETDTELSKQVLFGKMSEVLRKKFTDKNGELNSDLYDQDIMKVVHKSYPDASQEVIAELMKKGYIEESIIKQGSLEALQYVLMAFHAIPKGIGWLLKKFGEGIDLLKIDDKLWDTENETYFLKKENFIAQLSISTETIKGLEELLKAKEGFDITDIAPSFITEKAQEFLYKLKNIIGIYNSLVEQQVDEFYNTLNNPVGYILFSKATESFAFFAGIWNGVVDFLSGIFHFVGDILQTPFDQVSDFQTTLENFDNFCDAVWSADFWNNLWEGIKAMYHKIKESLKSNNLEDYNWVRIAYFSGFSLATIASFFIPVAQLTNLAKAGKFGPLIAKFTKEISAGAAKTTAVVTEKGKQAQQAVVKIFSEILDVISTGGTKLKKFFENIWQKIVDWFLKNSRLVRKIANVINEGDLLKLAKTNGIKVLIQEVQTIIKITGGRKDLAEAVLLSLKEVVEGKSILQLVRRFAIKETPRLNSLSNYQARIWYSWRKMQIEKQIKRIKKLEDKAKKAFELRNEYRTATRQYMKDRKLAEYLEIVEKNQEWEILLQRTMKKDIINSLDEAYKEIIKKSMSGRDEVDDLFKLKK